MSIDREKLFTAILHAIDRGFVIDRETMNVERGCCCPLAALAMLNGESPRAIETADASLDTMDLLAATTHHSVGEVERFVTAFDCGKPWRTDVHSETAQLAAAWWWLLKAVQNLTALFTSVVEGNATEAQWCMHKLEGNVDTCLGFLGMDPKEIEACAPDS